jgi:hypothetical protein
MKKEIVIELDRTGKTVGIEVKGGSGRECLDLTRFLEESLGVVASRHMKREGFLNRSVLKDRLTVKRT